MLLLGMMLLVSGCSLGGFGSSGKSEIKAPPAINSARSDAITADIYVDGTTSMYGYVNYAGGTIYGEAVKSIERTITETWKNDSIKYIKFGDEFQELNRNDFLKMQAVSFYDQKETSLQNVIEQTNDKNLSILVTDLFQTNQDLESLIRVIKNKGLDSDKAVAVIGFKSQFNGKVFDVGKNMASFTYASTDDPKTFRPVYLLILGNENDTRAFVKGYLEKLPEKAQASVAFFSSNLGVDNILEADKITNKKDDKKGETAKMAVMTNILPNGDIMQYRLKKDEKVSESPVRLFGKDVLGRIPASYVLKTDEVEVWNKSSNAFEVMSADNFLTATKGEAGINNGVVNIPFKLEANSGAIHKKVGIYRAKISLIPDKSEYTQAINTFSNWNFDDSQIDENNETLQQIGNKTLNISKFISMLSNLNYEINSPGFHNIYIYFDVK